jgi:DNA polymerase-3 subunit delta
LTIRPLAAILGHVPPLKETAVDTYYRMLGDIEAGRIEPVYYLCGPERLLIDRLVVALRRAVLDPATAEFNHDVVSAGEASIGKILQLPRTVSMLGGRRLVEVRDADALPAESHDDLLAYLAHPVPDAVLLFTGTKSDARFKLWKTLDQKGWLGKFEAVRGAPLFRFLQAEAKRLEVRFAPGAVELLVDLVGTDFLTLASAVEKLCLYVGAGGTIPPEAIDQVVSETRQAVIFELTDAIGDGNVATALPSLRALLEAGEPEVKILVMIARQIRLIWMALAARGEQGPRVDLGPVLGVPPFVARKIGSQADRFTLAAIRVAHERIYQTDRALKSSRVPRPLILEKLVIDLCAQQARSTPIR